MDILIDTNVIISAAIFPNPRMNVFLSLVSEEHHLFLCSYSLEELRRVVARKFPKKAHDVENFLRKLNYTLVHTQSVDIIEDIVIRDVNDYPILASAIISEVDVLITGDKDFECLNLEKPEILTIREFIEKFS